MSNIVIEGLEYVEAPEVITSLELEDRFKDTRDMFGIPENFIESFSGVSARRVWPLDVKYDDVALLSAKKLLDRLNIDVNEIGIIVNTSLTKRYVEPTIAVLLHEKLGLNDRCINFDVSNACVGFSNAINIISSLLKTEKIKYGLVVCGEHFHRYINLATDRLSNADISLENFMLEFATLTLGSGSVSMLLCKEEDSIHNSHLIKGQMFSVDSKHTTLNMADRDQMVCRSQDMLKAGIPVLNRTLEICNEVFPDWKQIDRFFPHQVSWSHIKALSKVTGIDVKDMEVIFPQLGNISSASWPIAIAIAENEKRLVNGMDIGVLSMGTGFNCSCLRINW